MSLSQAIAAAVAQAKSALANISTAADFPAMLIEHSLDRLKHSSHILGLRDVPDDVLPTTEIPVEDLLNEMAQLIRERKGFTLAPVPDASDSLIQPSSGHCVALPGTDYTISQAFQPVGSSNQLEPTPMGVRAFSRWIDFMEPVLTTGTVWLGGYGSGGRTFDTEVTIVFRADQEPLARDAATQWEQRSYWTIDLDHPNGGDETPMGGTPCASVFDALERHRNQQTNR